MKYQLFALAGCPASAALALFMRDAGIEYDRIVLASPRHAADVLALLSESESRCPALSYRETSATGLAACLALLSQSQPERASLAHLKFPATDAMLIDGVLSGRVLMARNERAFSLALADLRDAIREWSKAMPAPQRRAGLFVPYLDLRVANGLSGGRFKLAGVLGADENALESMAYRLPGGFEDAYLDRLRRGRSWVYWEGDASILGGRAMPRMGSGIRPAAIGKPAAGSLLA
ncbi:hypothetical protein P3W85_16345 [Cupriavidus basilensis]|uniref:Uncharacterized protein n=1 Tax=Cupriavidus basilensis TaxID=68895 RepID=A0ABT6API0_9BURK|nr:hypothetical protein [Cupriavidus basilensis]MDF3834513.1 hypothetical protein [Cupriavidus basilensis]